MWKKCQIASEKLFCTIHHQHKYTRICEKKEQKNWWSKIDNARSAHSSMVRINSNNNKCQNNKNSFFFHFFLFFSFRFFDGCSCLTFEMFPWGYASVNLSTVITVIVIIPDVAVHCCQFDILKAVGDRMRAHFYSFMIKSAHSYASWLLYTHFIFQHCRMGHLFESSIFCGIVRWIYIYHIYSECIGIAHKVT